jgi:hypothetical protein
LNTNRAAPFLGTNFSNMTILFKPHTTTALGDGGVWFSRIQGVEAGPQHLESLCDSNIRKVFPSVDFSN